MEFIFGVLIGISLVALVLVLFVLVRISQFASAHSSVYQLYLDQATSVIVMHDFYRGSRELQERLDQTVKLFRKLEHQGSNSVILLTSGFVKSMRRKVDLSEVNKRYFLSHGIPPLKIEVYRGQDGRGGNDTYGESLLACEWLATNREHSCYLVGNTLQLFQSYYICIYQGILPRLHVVPIMEDKSDYAVGKLVQAMFLLLDPSGRNPLNYLIRMKRRFLTADSY